MLRIQAPPLPPSPPLDPNFLVSQIIPLVGMVAALIVGGVVLYQFLRSDLAAALAERIRAGIKRRGGPALDEGRIAELEAQMHGLHGHVNELAERLDFAERMLAQPKRSHGDL